MNRKKYIFLICISSMMISSLFSGCGILLDNEASTTKSANSEANLAAGQYYVWHNDKEDNILNNLGDYVDAENDIFFPVYINECTFTTSTEDNMVASVGYGGDKSRIIWFMDGEEDEIPTLYKGDELILRSNSSIPEKFIFERFEDYGYTIGISGLTTNATGRCVLYEGNGNIMSYSDANVISGTHDYIFDSLGGISLTEDDISDAGTILNLERGETYNAEIYVGTVDFSTPLTANVHTLVSMEAFSTIDYTLPESNIAIIQIPDYFKTGYYLINGFGLFRYVDGTSWDDETDFNDPIILYDEEGNVIYDPTVEDDTENIENEDTEISSDENNDSTNSSSSSASVDEIKTYTVSISEEMDKYLFEFEYTQNKVDGFNKSVYAEITSPSGEVHKEYGEKGKISTYITSPETGDWTINVYNLNGGDCEMIEEGES